MALMLLLGTSSAWGWTVYYDNSGTPDWSDVYVVLGHDSYHRGDYKMTKVSDSENLYYLTKDDWGDAKYVTFSNTIVAQNGSNKGFKTAITSGYYSFNNGASSLNHLLFKKNGTNLTTIEGLYPRLIFNCNHIGFYVGEYQDWNQTQFYVHTSNKSDHISSHSPFKDGTTSNYGVVYATSQNYHVTHNTSWPGPTMGESAVLGTAYLVKNDNEVSKNAGTLPSCTFSIDNTIKAGETSTKSVTSSGKSKYGTQDYAEDSYYVKKSGETSLTKLEVEGSELQTQSLAVGEYTIYVLLFDGRIYAKGGEQTLTVETACEKPSEPSITINHVSICSRESAIIEAGQIDDAILYSLYKGNNDAPAQTNNTGIFEVSEAASYRVTVTTTCGESRKSSFVTLSKKTGPTASNYVIKDASKSKEYTGSEQTLTAEDITVNNNAGPVASVYFKQDGNIVDPINVGDYEVYVTTTATDDICAGDVMIGTFTITCPAPAEVPTYSVTQQTTSCKGTDNKIGIITLNNYDADYTYKLNDKAVTITDKKITGLAADSYTISAAKTCGSAKSESKSGTSVDITSTDLTPTIAKPIEIFGKNEICAGESTELTCNVEASKGRIESYSWNQAGTKNVDKLITASLDENTNYVATVTITNDGCSKDFESASYLVTVNPVPSFTTEPSDVTLCSSSTPISVAELIAETKATASNSATIKLYDGNGVEITDPIDINVDTQTTRTYKLKASKATCSSEFVEFTLTVNPIPTAPNFGDNNSETVCQGTTVNLPTELNSVQLKWYEELNRKSSITSFKADAEKTVYAASFNETCESAELTEYTYNIYSVPTISVSASTTDATCYQMVTLTANTGNTVEGALVEWYEGETLVGTGDTYTFTKETKSSATITAKVRNYTACDYVTANATVSFTAHEVCSTNSYVQGKIVYMRIGDNTFGKNESGAWYAAYFYKGNTSTWVRMTDEDNDETWACEIPDGYTHIIFVRMKPGTSEMKWDNKKDNQTAGDNKVLIPSSAKVCVVTNSGDHKWQDLESGKTFKTIALNGNGKWNVGGASIYAHPWSMRKPNTDGWSRMIPGINAGEYLVDVYADYTDIMFERRDPSGNKYDGGADKHKTADLVLDTYGNNFVITKAYQQDYPDAKADGEWQWKWYEDSYTLGLSTKASVADGSTTINATGAFYRTDCAPGLEFGFKYIKAENAPTENDWASANAQYVNNRPIAVGEEFTMNIDAAGGGIYWVRSYGRYNNNTYTYGNVVRVIVQGCTAGYEFEVANTSAVVQACGESRVLPTIEFLSNTEVAGETFTYQWKNEDDSDATNLSATNVATPTFNGKSSQNYKVIVAKMVGGQLKCSKTATYQVAYDDNSPKAVITAPETVKINEAVTIQGAVHYTESFTWTVKENDVDVTSTMLSDASILNPTFNTKEAGTYVITLTAAANLSCSAHSVTHKITIEAPTEDCASSEIEIAVDLTNQGNFNTGNNVYIFDECTYITKLYKENTYIFTKEYIEENGYPKVMIASQQDYDQHYAYMKPTQLTEKDHLGKKVTFKFNNSAYQDQNNAICTYDGKNYNREYYDISVTTSDISNTVSAPTISSPKAVVNDDTKKATLSAYLAKTGCSTITNYGFQYIESDTEPSESDWTNSNKTTTQDLGNNIVIGKTFKSETTVLDQGKYWFRAYAKNAAGKISYTSPISFEIIADGPYPVFIDAVQGHESEAALYINDEGKIVVKIYNKGKDDDDDVLEGSYKLIIENQNQNILFTPLIKNTPIEHQSSVTFTSKDKVANLDHYNITATLTYKGRKDTRNISKCTPIKAAQDTDENGLRDTIYYTIDAAAVTDKCMLVFPSVYEAVEHLKKSSEAEEDYQYTKKIGNGYILQQPVVMQVAYSTNRYKGNISVNTTGGGDKANALIIPIIDINNDDDNGNCKGGEKYNDDEGNSEDVKYYSLTIRALNENAIPTLQHIAIRDSRYITLDKLNIVASNNPKDKDNALDIDCNNNSWVGNARGKFKNTYVTVKNCDIKSKGFTCVHVSAVDKVHFLNNEITAELDNSDLGNDDNGKNVRCWGASVKFIRSTNLSFIRNNFMGTHATSIWLQEVDGALFMNNVLWNNNKIEYDIFAMFRIVHQTGDYHPKNIGIYYNTLFLDNNGERSASPEFNFLTLNSDDSAKEDDAIAHKGEFDTNTIEFMYNNCYSYDTRTPGKTDNPFKDRKAWTGLCYNNFWSEYDEIEYNKLAEKEKESYVSVFAFGGCDDVKYKYINVKNNVCTTGATSPHSLVISGDKLNLGVKPATTLANQLGADLLKSDRNRSNVRPESTGWTLGAYQQTEPQEVSTIIWQGEAGTDWDNRNNWIDADTKRVLTCTHELAVNLTVIIPAPQSEKYQVPGEEGIVNYPIIPQFGSRKTNLYGSELVNAGQRVGGDNSGKFADVIEIEYGGSLQGVQNLVNRYGEAKTNFTAGRDQWTLVGTVVKPWTDKLTRSTRNIKSGDYFIEKQTPHVYMHYAYMDGNTAKWSEPFTSKEESLEVTDVMAINLPNQYGEYKLTSQDYYTYSPEADPKKLNDNVVPKNYEFVGEFVNEASLPSITGLKENEPVLLNNSYPCNIDPKKLQNGQGTVWMYDYKGGSFSLTSDDDVLIKPQHGFIFKPTGTKYEVTEGMLVSGDTKSRSAEDEMPIFSLNLFNANSTEGEYSRVIVKYDELGDNGPVDLDLEKMFAENASTPELYIVMYDGKYQRVHVNSKEIVIPLGIRLMTSMNVSFQKFKSEGFDKVTLVDEVANKEYDLLSGKEVVTEKLLAGDIEGRFFLNLKEKEEDDDIEDDDNVSTEIEEDSAEQSINILVEGDNTVKVITNGVELENIYVSDMTGRTVGYKASGYSAVVELPVAQGVYMINVIGDTASRTEKVILK